MSFQPSSSFCHSIRRSFLFFPFPDFSFFPSFPAPFPLPANRFAGYRWRGKKGEKKGSDKFDQTARFIAFQLPFNLLREIGCVRFIILRFHFSSNRIRKLCDKCFRVNCSRSKKGKRNLFEKKYSDEQRTSPKYIDSLTLP